jgi:hypothetical protein
MKRFACPYLGGEVELTDERRGHIDRHHPEFGEALESLLRAVLGRPDEIRRDTRYGSTRLFSCFVPTLLDGKHMVVGVVSDPPLAPSSPSRHWIVTAYPARELTQGATEWKAD